MNNHNPEGYFFFTTANPNLRGPHSARQGDCPDPAFNA